MITGSCLFKMTHRTLCVADSMLDSRSEAGTRVEMQLLNFYRQHRMKIKVSLLKVQKQDNHIDCGVFAIVFRTEFCFTGLKGVLNAEYYLLTFRQHLVNCLENLELVPFRKKIKFKITKTTTITITKKKKKKKKKKKRF